MKRLSIDEIVFLAKLRSLYWVKASKEGCIVIESQWWSNPRLCVRCSKQSNVDGAAREKPWPAGCGGVLRDHSGKIVANFSGSL
ncbi:hypothetical protein Goklo_022829, partial [Gossypium klotzschianum]|nr:hypothetical protein [Gossypium klotzschianum]